MTIIESRPFRNGWRCFEAPGVEPVFLDQEQAIDYALTRACFRAGEIQILDSSGAFTRTIPFNVKTAHTLKIREPHVITVARKACYDIGHAPEDHSNRRTSPKDYAVWEIHPVMKPDMVQ